MGLALSLFCLLLTVLMISGHLYPDDRTIQRSGREDGEKGRKVQIRIQSRQRRSASSQENHECQEGNPLGASYLGKTNVTTSGRTCQVWAASHPHEHDYTYVGEHNYCRNPYDDPLGVYCYTTDPDKRWEYCSVPKCAPPTTTIAPRKMTKVLDFSADNDHESDNNDKFTSATLNAGVLF